MMKSVLEEKKSFSVVHGNVRKRSQTHACVTYFNEERHKEFTDTPRPKVKEWRVKNQIQTKRAALVLCLNLGFDLPDLDVNKRYPQLQTWFDPMEEPPHIATEQIGNRLQEQYEQTKTSARFHHCLDPSEGEIMRACEYMRGKVPDSRVLFHYNGLGVPKPNSKGEEGRPYYKATPVDKLLKAVGSPAIYVFDCSAAGTLFPFIKQFEKDCLSLAACGANETLPSGPEYPGDLFTSCLTTPIKMALYYACRHSLFKTPLEIIHAVPGDLRNRQTPLGELNWIFTVVTDCIAWQVLPTHMFHRLFRKDILVATLYRNFFLAERIMRTANCNPMSLPPLPTTCDHPVWMAWDLVVELALSQIQSMLKNPAQVYKPSTFLADQLTAFEMWLGTGSELHPPPELPILYQALLVEMYRNQALSLLARFLDLGPWAINLALSIGIYQCLLNLLEKGSESQRQLIAFCWAKIIAYDKSCQLELVKHKAHLYFMREVTNMNLLPAQRALALFVLTAIVNNCRPGQSSCLQTNLLPVCLQQAGDPDAIVRKWAVTCLAKLWENFEMAKQVAIRAAAQKVLCHMLSDVHPEVRAAVVHALGTLIGGAEGNEERTTIELTIGLTLPVLHTPPDASPLVRKELIITLSHLVAEYDEKFNTIARESQERTFFAAHRGRSERSLSVTTSSHVPSVESIIWRIIQELSGDPHPEVAQLAAEVVRSIAAEISGTQPGNISPRKPSSPVMYRTDNGSPPFTNTPSPPSSPIRSHSLPSSVGAVTCGDDYLTSNYFEWSANFYSRSIIIEDEDLNDPAAVSRRLRVQRNERLVRDAHDINDFSNPTTDKQISLLNNESGEALALQFHSFENLLATADTSNTITVWNWEQGQKVNSFSNSNSTPSIITALRFINESDSTQLLTTSSDGSVRIWDGIERNDTLQLVAAWKALPEVSSHNSSSVVVAWQQEHGRLFASGDVSFVRVWDAERECSVQDIPTECDTAVTSIACNGHVFVTGCLDGSVILFDIREKKSYSLVRTFTDTISKIIGVTMIKARPNTIVSSTITGEINFWQLGHPSPTHSMSANYPLSSVVVHDFAPVLACGSKTQKIKLINFGGEALGTIKYQEGFLGQRIGPVSCLAFHPYGALLFSTLSLSASKLLTLDRLKMFLAAGTTDSLVSIYTTPATSNTARSSSKLDVLTRHLGP